MGEINCSKAQKEAAMATNLDVGSETECQAFFFTPCSLAAWQCGKSSCHYNCTWSYFLNLVIHVCILSVICIFLLVTQLFCYLENDLSLLCQEWKQYYSDEDKDFFPAEMNCLIFRIHLFYCTSFYHSLKEMFKNTSCKISPNDTQKSKPPSLLGIKNIHSLVIIVL